MKKDGNRDGGRCWECGFAGIGFRPSREINWHAEIFLTLGILVLNDVFHANTLLLNTAISRNIILST